MVKFQLGNLYQTRGIAAAIEAQPAFYIEVIEAYQKYIAGNYGDLCEEDIAANEEAIATGGRILAAYTTSQGRIYIITEADRSATTILFCNEY